jgi:hypothetical protein
MKHRNPLHFFLSNLSHSHASCQVARAAKISLRHELKSMLQSGKGHYDLHRDADADADAVMGHG